ncbi:MAG: aldo/keto reductase, partial [Pseudomonadota bacterium]
VEALAKAQQAGKIKHIGLSNVTKEQLVRALTVAPIASVQNRFNQVETDASELVDYTHERGIAFIPYGPLGAHPMKQGAKLPPKEAIAWLVRRSPNIIVIPGTTSIDHLRDNASAWDLHAPSTHCI